MHAGLTAFLVACAANGIPLLTYDAIPRRWAYPIDGGAVLPDGKRLFGSSKTIPGLLASLALTPLFGMLLGLEWGLGLLIAVGAMAGDLLSSFTKRRLGMKSGSMALGLDQIPEILFPLLLVRIPLSLTWTEIALLVAGFIVFELVISRFLFKVHLREHPY